MHNRKIYILTYISILCGEIKIKRKVVKHGPSTLIVSLPNAWVKEHGIEKGMELNVEQKENDLIISTTKKKELKYIEFDISNMSQELILFCLRTIYRKGYDQVKLNFKEQKCIRFRDKTKDNLIISIIHDEVDNLIGYEIIEQKEKSCLIADVSEDSGKNFENIIRKIFLIMDQTFQDVILGIKNKDATLLQTISHKHDTISRFINYSMRVLNKGVHNSPSPQDMYNILSALDRIADIMKYSSIDISENKVPFCAVDIDVFYLIGEYIKLFEKFFYNYSNENALELIKTRFEFIDKLKSLQKTKATKGFNIVCEFGDIVEILNDVIVSRISFEL